MPSSYTYPVVEGKITEFPAFALLCARAFGALIHMREDDLDKPVPEEIPAQTSYYEVALTKAQHRLGEVLAMTSAEAQDAAEAEHNAALQSRIDYLASKDAEAARLNAMLAKVRAWTPPSSDHVEMKKFMIDQLTQSMPGEYCPPFPVLLDGETWRKSEGDKLANEIVRYKAEVAKEWERAASRTEWLKSLRDSLAA